MCLCLYRSFLVIGKKRSVVSTCIRNFLISKAWFWTTTAHRLLPSNWHLPYLLSVIRLDQNAPYGPIDCKDKGPGVGRTWMLLMLLLQVLIKSRRRRFVSSSFLSFMWPKTTSLWSNGFPRKYIFCGDLWCRRWVFSSCTMVSLQWKPNAFLYLLMKHNSERSCWIHMLLGPCPMDSKWSWFDCTIIRETEMRQMLSI